MPVFEIETPDGTFEVEAPNEMAAMAALGGVDEPNVGVAAGAKAMQPAAPEYNQGAFRAASEGLRSGAMFGWDDEIGAGMNAVPDAAIEWLKGNGFDVGRSYNRVRDQLEREKAGRRAQHPIATGFGEIAGGLGAGLGASKAGITLTGRTLPLIGKTGAAALEGAAYGGLSGAGNAKSGERTREGLKGAAVGAVTGAALQKGGEFLANRAARKVTPPAPALDELQRATDDLYSQARAAGITVKAPATDRMVANVEVAAGRLNNNLRPQTLGIVDEARALKGRNLSLDELDEFRQTIGNALKGASPDDARTLMQVKRTVDAFADRIGPGDFTGNPAGFGLIKEARALNARRAKTKAIEDLLDLADVDSAKFTQSGAANAVKTRSRELYRRIVKGYEKGFSKEEIALIRQMAKGGSTSQMVNWMAKLSPRGAVSLLANFGVGGAAGSMLGPAGTVIGAATAGAGHLAGRAADKGALAAANNLRDAAARGFVYRPPMLPNRALPLIPGATEAAMAVLRGQQSTPQR